jgi:hypothetical protein
MFIPMKDDKENKENGHKLEMNDDAMDALWINFLSLDVVGKSALKSLWTVYLIMSSILQCVQLS